MNKEKSTEDTSQQGLSNCGTCTTGSTPATVQWYMGFVRKNQRMKKQQMSFNKCSYIENLIKLFFIYIHKIINGGTMNVFIYI
jgi:hypothetical protein